MVVETDVKHIIEEDMWGYPPTIICPMKSANWLDRLSVGKKVTTHHFQFLEFENSFLEALQIKKY